MSKKKKKKTVGEASGLDDIKKDLDSENAPEPEPEKIENLELDIDFLKQVVAFPFNYASVRVDPKWKLADVELENLARLSDVVLNKYLPALLLRFGAEIALGGYLSFVILNRIFQANAGQANNSDPRKAGNGKNDMDQTIPSEPKIEPTVNL